MAKRTIILHPDPRLKKVCDAVDGVDDALRALIDDMYETMYAAPGIGLAAPQVGVTARVVVMDCGGKAPEDGDEPEPPNPIALVNPQIIWRSEETSTYNEGCLSIPEQFEDVTRPASVTVAYLDRDGAPCERRFDGLEATCVQHEVDHLEGKLFIDYVGAVKRAMITQKMKKLKRERAKERAAEKARA